MAAFGTVLRSNVGKLLTPFGTPSVPKGTGYNISQTIANLGHQLNLPELHISEAFGNAVPVAKASDGGGQAPQVLSKMTDTPSQPSVTFNDLLTKPQYAPTSKSIVLPSSGGQGAAGGAGAPQGQGGDPYQSNDLGELRNSFAGLRSTIEGQLPGLEADYNRTKGDVQAAIDRAKGSYDQSTQDINKGYGENLRSLIQTDQELRQKNRNVFSGLNTLDSSSYQDSYNKADQNFVDTQGSLQNEKEKQLRDADSQYKAYESQANSQLASLGSQYLQGKQALQQAIAQNRLDEASTIQNYIAQIKDRANQVNDSLNTFKLNAAQLMAQGVDVVGNLNKINRSGLDQTFGRYLSGTYNPGMASLNYTTPSITGQGYITGKSGKKYNSLAEAQAAGDA